jgi:hypothetical protein
MAKRRMSNWASADIRYGFTQRRPGPISDRRCGYFSMGRNPRGPKPPANSKTEWERSVSGANRRRTGMPEVGDA